MLLEEMTKLEGGRYQDENGIILPWYTSPCLEWLQTLDLKDKFVFEFGVGDSTEWYRKKGAYAVGVDSDIEWVKKTGSLHAIDRRFYLNALQHVTMLAMVQFDIIVIDGLYRDECTDYALPYLKPGGYLILDNFEQPSVEEFWPLTRKLIEGMPITIYKEPLHYDWQTAVIQKTL